MSRWRTKVCWLHWPKEECGEQNLHSCQLLYRVDEDRNRSIQMSLLVGKVCSNDLETIILLQLPNILF